MALYKHTLSLQTKRLIQWFRDKEGNHEIHIYVNGKETVFPFTAICYANRKYEHLASL